MYENNYNYIEVGESEKKKKGNAGKTAALLLAVIVAGGASGYGGAYLQNRNATQLSVAAVAENEAKNTDEGENATTAVPTASGETKAETMVSDLVSGTSEKNGELTTEEIVNKVSSSVVSIKAVFSQGTSTGTGIIMSSDGYIITNAHVIQSEEQQRVENSGGNGYTYDPFDFFGSFFGDGFGYQTETVTVDAKEVTVVLSDNETEYTAKIIGADKDSDLAVLKIEAENLSPAEFGNSDELRMGKRAIAIGYPMGLGLSVSEGVVSGLNRELSVELSSGGNASMTLIQTDAAINPGNSGGPLINEYGQVIGITSSKLASTKLEGLGFAIPITDAMPLLNDLMTKGYVTNHTPQIGITGSNITPAVARYYGLPVTSGVLVVSVTEGSGADLAGICEGDVIVAADGKEVASMDDLTSVKDGKEIGDTLTVTLARNDENEEVTVTLTEADDVPRSDDDTDEEEGGFFGNSIG